MSKRSKKTNNPDSKPNGWAKETNNLSNSSKIKQNTCRRMNFTGPKKNLRSQSRTNEMQA